MTRRKVLVLCYYFPPTPSAGAVRMRGLVKYLPRFGWEATVVTPRRADRQPGLATVVETDDADLATRLKRLLGLRTDAALKDLVFRGSGTPSSGLRLKARLIETAKSLVAFPDTNRRWIRIATRAAVRLVEEQRFDALLTSSPPPSVQVAGGRVKGLLGLPWIADLRDLWSNDNYSMAPGWRQRLDRRLEIRTFRRADALVTVSEPLADELRLLHPQTTVHSIPNGFDPELVTPGVPLERQLTITHTGTLHQGRRDPTMLFAAVRQLLQEGRIPRQAIRIRLYTRHEPWVAALARKQGLAEVVEFPEWASAEATCQAQRESQILLILHWGDRREAGVYTAKLFEYLAARRPILLLGGPRGVISELLEESRTGIHLTDQRQLERQLLQWWDQIQARGTVPWHGREASLERFSQLRMAEDFARLMESLG